VDDQIAARGHPANDRAEIVIQPGVRLPTPTPPPSPEPAMS
jgi:hypothetical protein